MKKKIIDDAFISQLETLTMNMLTPMKGYFGGSHKTNTYGNTIEFADFREYVLGDDLRRIDWNLYSRFEKHFIKLFVDERQMHIQLFLDCSASMARVSSQKAEYALRTIAALGYLSVHNMDKLSIYLMQDQNCVDVYGMIVGKDAYYNAVKKLEQAKFEGCTNISAAVSNCLNIGNNDGLTVIVSDFLTDNDWKKAVDYLLYRHRQVMLIQILDPIDIDPTYSGKIFLRDAESDNVLDSVNLKMRINPSTYKAYRTALAEYIGDMRTFCSSRGVDLITVKSDSSVEKLIFGKLAERSVVK